jgi:hypothetical protein
MKTIFYLCIAAYLTGCSTLSKTAATKKYPVSALQEDYSLFRSILEESHPGLYWYTPKDSMDFYFEEGRKMLRDSMREPQFKNVLSYVLSHVRCGHTTARSSKSFLKYGDSLRNRTFPLFMKFWEDTTVIATNISRDSMLKRGSLVKAIDNKPVMQIVDSLFKFMSGDGYNETHLYQSLSNRGGFSSLFFTVYGFKPRYKIDYIDSAGNEKTSNVPVYIPPRDTTKKPPTPAPTISRRERKKQRIQSNRELTIDTALNAGFLELNTFTKGNKLRSFYRKSFKKLREEKVKNLVIDLRINGGGSVNLSNLFTKYISDHRFKIADSLYALNRSSRYASYMKGQFWNKLFMVFFTKKRSDGNYHFGYFERKYFQPKKKNHFDGKVYVLTGGNTFSASTLFARTVKPQENVFIVGEETGGGDYGNNAWIIPDVTLPNTKVRFRLPLFRLVTDKDAPKGYGVMPEIFVGPTVESIRRNVDYKMEVVRRLIAERP